MAGPKCMRPKSMYSYPERVRAVELYLKPASPAFAASGR
jgi:hypothetical protein